jgi:hypothetical protein
VLDALYVVGTLAFFALMLGYVRACGLVAVGLARLTLVASGGLIAAGATLQRLAKRAEDRTRAERLGDDR